MMKSMVKYGNHSHHFEGILCSCGKIIHLLLYLVNRNEDAHNPIFNLKEGWGGGGGGGSFLCKLYHVPNIII